MLVLLGPNGLFFEIMGLTENEVCKFRFSTTRKNVGYSIQEYKAPKIEDEDVQVRQLVDLKKEQYAPDGQIIVYCETVKQAQRFAKLLDCQAYHREAGSTAEKKSILSDLRQRNGRVFTATNALGLGRIAITE